MPNNCIDSAIFATFGQFRLKVQHSIMNMNWFGALQGVECIDYKN